jgi:hypothetical protein
LVVGVSSNVDLFSKFVAFQEDTKSAVKVSRIMRQVNSYLKYMLLFQVDTRLYWLCLRRDVRSYFFAVYIWADAAVHL